MDKNQTSKNNMYGKMKVFFANSTFAAMWATFTVLVDDIALFMTKKGQLDAFILQQQTSITGITEDKTAEMKKAEKLTIKLSKKGKTWAKKTGNNTLKALFSITKTELSNLAGAETIAKMTEIVTALIAQATPLAAYNITTTNTDDLTALITSADALLGTPGSAQAGTEAGTEGIATKMKEIDDVLENIDNVLIPEYEDDDLEAVRNMVAEYKNNRVIDNVGHHATKLIGNMQDAATLEKLQGITMTIIELGRSAVSDIEGVALIERFKAGTYHVKFEGEGYVTQILIITTKRGKKVEVVVKMVVEVVVV